MVGFLSTINLGFGHDYMPDKWRAMSFSGALVGPGMNLGRILDELWAKFS